MLGPRLNVARPDVPRSRGWDRARHGSSTRYGVDMHRGEQPASLTARPHLGVLRHGDIAQQHPHTYTRSAVLDFHTILGIDPARNIDGNLRSGCTTTAPFSTFVILGPRLAEPLCLLAGLLQHSKDVSAPTTWPRAGLPVSSPRLPGPRRAASRTCVGRTSFGDRGELPLRPSHTARHIGLRRRRQVVGPARTPWLRWRLEPVDQIGERAGRRLGVGNDRPPAALAAVTGPG